jgi:hypothetical protein
MIRANRTFCILVAAYLGATGLARLTAAEQLAIVVAQQAPALERFAAAELKTLLSRLLPIDVAIRSDVPPDAQRLILLGTPVTHRRVDEALGANRPNLSDQGHMLKSCRFDGRPTLVLAGGTPVAALWAVYELGHRYGVRYLLSGDVFPAQPASVDLDRLEVVLEPAPRLRVWRTIDDFPIGPESWPLADHKRLLGQLAKLKFNRVLLSFHPWQPFVDFSFADVHKSTATLWYGYRYRVDGDTPGRAAFGGKREFYNPDLEGKDSYGELTAAGIELARGVIAEARKLGMSAAIAISPLEFPKEFAAVLPGAKVHGLENLMIAPGPHQRADDPRLLELALAQLNAYLQTYPQIDALYLSLPESPDWSEQAESAWQRLARRNGLSRTIKLDDLLLAAARRPQVPSGQRRVAALRGSIAALDFVSTLLQRSGLQRRLLSGRRDKLEINLLGIDPALFPLSDELLPHGLGVLQFVDCGARRQAATRANLTDVPTGIRSSLILMLVDDNVGILPRMATNSLHALMGELGRPRWEGFATRFWTVGEFDPEIYYLSRASFEPGLTPAAAYQALFAPFCGAGAADRLVKALDAVEQATCLIDEHDPGLGFPVPGLVMKQYNADPAPDWWKQAAALYTTAMNEALRAHDAALPTGRSFTSYLAKRMEFAVEYFGGIEAVRLAGQAKAQGDHDTQVEQLERAVERLYNALMALGSVARDQSDRGVIAVVNEHGYRPLVKEYEAVSAVDQ